MTEASIAVVDSKELLSLFGTRDRHMRQIRDSLGVTIAAREDHIYIQGDEERVAQATEVFAQLRAHVTTHGSLDASDVARVLSNVQSGGPATPAPAIDVLTVARKVRPRTSGQARYVEAVRENDLTFCTGPAGTGKTYLAVALAVAALKQEQVRKLVLCRPAVEAGESLGYLPGDLQAKINPYLRPLLDALREMMDYEQIKRYTERDVIEVVPLAYMRGRTLNEAFIILDEAQNTTVAQMKMFLTRLGNGSKIIVQGDTTQIDLPAHARSGLIDALERLRGIEGCGTVRLTTADIVRHPLVERIVRAYDDIGRRRR